MLINLIFIYNIYIIYKYSFRLCKWKSPKRPASHRPIVPFLCFHIRISLTIQTEKVDSSYCIYSPSDFLAKLARKTPLKNGGFWTENLRARQIFRNFAVAMKMQRRLRAAAQRRPSELASAFSDLKVQSVASQSPCTAVVIVNQKYSWYAEKPAWYACGQA